MSRIVLFLAASLLTSLVHGATDISIFISREYAEQATVQAIEDRVALPVPIKWNAKASILTGQSIHLRAEGSYSGITALVLSMDVLFDCGESAPAGSNVNACNPDSFVYIAPDNFDVTTIAGSLPASILAQISREINKNFSSISNEITCHLDNAFRWTNSASVCPTITVSSKPDITASLDLLNGCINGKIRTTPCTGLDIGPGKTYQCVNGRWQFNSGFCHREPRVPPGGQPL